MTVISCDSNHTRNYQMLAFRSMTHRLTIIKKKMLLSMATKPHYVNVSATLFLGTKLDSSIISI